MSLTEPQDMRAEEVALAGGVGPRQRDDHADGQQQDADGCPPVSTVA